jgi:hypothetical protein
MTIPNRRTGITHAIDWQNNRVYVTFNYGAKGEIVEVFFKGTSKEGTALQDELGELGILTSLLIQEGWTVERLFSVLGRDGKQALVAAALEIIIGEQDGKAK